MSKATYLDALTNWALHGSRGPIPSTLHHGITLSELTSDDTAQAIDKGDPCPPAITSWTWWDSQHHADLHAWHKALRAAHTSGPTLTTDERLRAEAIYAETCSPDPPPRRRRRLPRGGR